MHALGPSLVWSLPKVCARAQGRGSAQAPYSRLVAGSAPLTLSVFTLVGFQARRLPKRRLLSSVRGVWEPREYPNSLEALYNWTPDEAIPEFYSDPCVLKSLHPDMPDLAFPAWAGLYP